MTAQVEETRSARGRLLGALDDRLNPILVKEVRQALRGRYFRISFRVTLLLATLLGLIILVRAAAVPSPGEVGLVFFSTIYGCLAGAVLFLVPFSGFISMGGEWEQNTYDLLAITDLRPRQIVMGKLVSALTQALLFYSAFTPFLAFAFVMRGVDLVGALVVFGGSMVLCGTLTLVAIALSCASRVRFARVALMAALAAGLVWVTGISITFASIIVRQPLMLLEPEAGTAAALTLTIAVLVCGLSFTFACARLAHPEENRSTGLRIVVALTAAAGLCWTAYIYLEVFPGEPALIPALGGATAAACLLPLLFVATEREELGRRVRRQVPANPLLALLVAPFLPGGGRGFLLLLSILGLILGGAIAIVWPTGSAASLGLGSAPLPWYAIHPFVELLMLVVVVVYGLAFVGLPAGLLARFARTHAGRSAVRATIPGFAMVALFLPTLVGLFLRNDELMRLQHFGNPGHAVIALAHMELDVIPRALTVMAVLAVVVIAINLPRTLRGVGEVLQVSAERRRRRAASPAEAQVPPSDAVAGS